MDPSRMYESFRSRKKKEKMEKKKMLRVDNDDYTTSFCVAALSHR